MAEPNDNLESDYSIVLLQGNNNDHGPGYKGNLKTYFGYTRKQVTTVLILGFANFFSSAIYALQAPFYPKEAEAKGASPTEYGFVLGVFQLVIFLMSGVYGYVLGIVNPRLVYNTGIFVTATCACLFGFLDYVEDHVTFIALSFVLRILQACGDAGFVTASFTIIAMEFPDSVASTFATLETTWGLGLIVGPGLGGALYELGGFILPFVFTAACLFVVGILTFLLLPEVNWPVEPAEGHTQTLVVPGRDKSGILSALRIPEVSLAIFSVVISATSIGFLVATLEPHLRENFGLSPAMTGLVFVIDGGMYALSAPIWGRFADKSREPKIFTLTGALLIFTGFVLIGPAPFVPLPTVLWLICIGLLIMGLGVGSTCVSAFLQALQGTKNNGFPDSVSTYGVVSGLWMSAFAFGNFIGPCVGGILLDNFGFRLSTVFVLATQAIVIILTSIFICSSKKGSKRSTGTFKEKESLLDDQHSKITKSVFDFNSVPDANTKITKHYLPKVISSKSLDYGALKK